MRDRITTAHEVCTGIPSCQTLGNQPQQTYQLHANISVSLQCLQRPELMILNVSKATAFPASTPLSIMFLVWLPGMCVLGIKGFLG